MARKFYVDTSVWRDYFEDRGNGIRPLGEFAFRFLDKCLKNRDKILVSLEIRDELLAYYCLERVKEVFSNYKEILAEVPCSERQRKEAWVKWIKENKRFPLSDIVHSVIARDNKATLVSRDRHFNEIGLIECFLPEELF